MIQIWFMKLWREKNEKKNISNIKTMHRIQEMREIFIHSQFETLKNPKRYNLRVCLFYNFFSLVSLFFPSIYTWHWAYGSLLLHKS